MSKQIDLDKMLGKMLSPEVNRILGEAGMLAAENNHALYLVGGTVRDLLLGYPLDQDFDLVIEGNACHFGALLQARIGGRLTVFNRYMTATLKLTNNIRLDLVTARRESYPRPAARPMVEASDLKDDLYRRDFTINAIACSLQPGKKTGLIYDYYHGINDLEQKMIRVFHPFSFMDDPLRIIRAARFEQRYEFSLEDRTKTYLKEAVAGKVISLVSRQRLQGEMKKIEQEPDPQKVLIRLEEYGLKL